MNAGFYLPNQNLKAHPAGCHLDMTELMESSIKDGQKVSPFVLLDSWIDIGLQISCRMRATNSISLTTCCLKARNLSQSNSNMCLCPAQEKGLGLLVKDVVANNSMSKLVPMKQRNASSAVQTIGSPRTLKLYLQALERQ